MKKQSLGQFSNVFGVRVFFIAGRALRVHKLGVLFRCAVLNLHTVTFKAVRSAVISDTDSGMQYDAENLSPDLNAHERKPKAMWTVVLPSTHVAMHHDAETDQP